MPGRRKGQEIRGLAFTATPNDWLHRVLHWPFYFESTNYSFRIRIKRVAPEDALDQWPNGVIPVVVIMENLNYMTYALDVPALEVGGETTEVVGPIYISNPGQTHLAIPLGPSIQGTNVAELFWYKVRPEEAIWLAGAALLLTLFTLLIPIYASSRFDDPPVINVYPGETTTAVGSDNGESLQETSTPVPR